MGDAEVYTLETPSACHAVPLHMQFPLVLHLTQATQWHFQHTVVMCTVGSFWSSLFGAEFGLFDSSGAAEGMKFLMTVGFLCSWGYRKSSQISYCKRAEGQPKTDETLLNPRRSRELSLSCRFPQWNICSCGEMSCGTHFTFLGGAVLPPHGRSLAEHGTRPLLHTDKPISSSQSTPNILRHVERTCVGVQSIVFCYSCTGQKIAGARQLKGVYKKMNGWHKYWPPNKRMVRSEDATEVEVVTYYRLSDGFSFGVQI